MLKPEQEKVVTALSPERALFMTVLPAGYWKNLIYQMFVLVKSYA